MKVSRLADMLERHFDDEDDALAAVAEILGVGCILPPCGCDEKHNLPMRLGDENNRHWIECDFCGKRTSQFPSSVSDVEATKQWVLIAGA